MLTVVELGFDEGALGVLGVELFDEQPQHMRNTAARTNTFVKVQ
jgi:hypothetical protein